jgi:hypothetical protein
VRRHEVTSHQCLTAIAVERGFVDRGRLLDAPANAELRETRPDPNLLREGDVVAVPDLVPRTERCATNQAHRLVIDLPKKELRIVLRGHDGTPLAGQDYTLELSAETRSGTTDGDGKLVETVGIRERGAVLRAAGRIVVLRLSCMGPVGEESDEEIRDLQSRLHNLGYDAGALDGVYGRCTRAALAVFQAEHGLDVNGEPDAATRARLEEEHGC